MRNRIYVLVFAINIFCHAPAFAQNYSVYNNYYVDQYLYNPAEVATEYAYLFVNHRQQWLGIDGAPVVTTVNFNTMFNESHAGIGVKASSYIRGLQSTTDFNLSYAYGVPFSQKTSMFFGLSAGAISNNIDVTNLDPADPAMSSYLENNIQPAADFGLLLRSASGLNLGIVLPQLLINRFNSAENFEDVSVSPLDNVLVTAYFRKKVESKIVSRNRKGIKAKVKTAESYSPLELYAMYKYSKIGLNQFEVMGKLNLSQNFWLGASYRQGYGLTGTLGFSIDRFLLSYSYEPGNQPEPAISNGTHEMQIGLRLGSPRKFRRETPVLRSTLKSATQQHSARFQHTGEDPDNINSEQQVKKKYYVVIRTFGDFISADAYKKKLVGEKYNANVFYYGKDKKYHVYVFETTRQSDAHSEVRNLKAYTKLKEARLLTVQE